MWIAIGLCIWFGVAIVVGPLVGKCCEFGMWEPESEQ